MVITLSNTIAISKRDGRKSTGKKKWSNRDPTKVEVNQERDEEIIGISLPKKNKSSCQTWCILDPKEEWLSEYEKIEGDDNPSVKLHI